MVGIDLLQEAEAAGLTVSADGDRLVVRGPKSGAPIARRLIEAKGPVLAALAARHSRAPVPRDVEHRRLDCACPRWWRHVWGQFYCAECFPCRDRAALVAEGSQ